MKYHCHVRQHNGCSNTTSGQHIATTQFCCICIKPSGRCTWCIHADDISALNQLLHFGADVGNFSIVALEQIQSGLCGVDGKQAWWGPARWLRHVNYATNVGTFSAFHLIETLACRIAKIEGI